MHLELAKAGSQLLVVVGRDSVGVEQLFSPFSLVEELIVLTLRGVEAELIVLSVEGGEELTLTDEVALANGNMLDLTRSLEADGDRLVLDDSTAERLSSRGALRARVSDDDGTDKTFGSLSAFGARGEEREEG